MVNNRSGLFDMLGVSTLTTMRGNLRLNVVADHSLRRLKHVLLLLQTLLRNLLSLKHGRLSRLNE